MMQFLAPTRAAPHILFNREGKAPSSSQLDIRSNGRFTKHCLAATLQYKKAFADPIGGENFVWSSDKPHSGAARINLLAVVNEVVARTGC